jgi:hypothetical protein
MERILKTFFRLLRVSVPLWLINTYRAIQFFGRKFIFFNNANAVCLHLNGKSEASREGLRFASVKDKIVGATPQARVCLHPSQHDRRFLGATSGLGLSSTLPLRSLPSLLSTLIGQRGLACQRSGHAVFFR